jgi:hypothetical protein
MLKISKQKFFLSTTLLMILLISVGCCAFIPNANATVITQTNYLLKNVVGIDIAKYTVSANEALPSQQPSLLGIVPQDTIVYNLTSVDSTLRVLFNFANGSIQTIYMLQNGASPHLTNAVLTPNAANISNINAAKSFLNNLQSYSGEALFSDLTATLSNINTPTNITKTFGDKVLQVNDTEGNTDFNWYYTANGAIAPYSKFIALDFANGSLSFFVNNWDLYSVGNTAVTLSKNQAVQTAIAAAKQHTWSIPLDTDTLSPVNFNELTSVSWASLTFDNSMGANVNRSSNQMTLYPVWRIGLVLNKFYGQLYGIEVDVWADNGQVRSTQEAYSTLPPAAY